MSFDLESHVVLVVKLHDAGVIFEDADAPVIFAQVFADLNRCRKDGLFEHVVEIDRTVFVTVFDSAGQRFVAAMFRPCLGNGFEFDIGWVTIKRNEMGFDRLHFDKRQTQLPLLADCEKFFAFEFTNRNERLLKFVFATEVQTLQFQRTFDDRFDRIIAQQFLNQRLTARFVQR